MFATRIRSVRWVTAILVPLSAAALGAQSVAPPLPSVDPRIIHVVTGGYWRAGGQEGRFRAVVLSAGVEHIISHLYVQWVSDENDTTAARVVATRAVDTISTGGWSLMEPSISRDAGEWQVVVAGVDSHFDPPRRGRWVVTVGAPGTVRVRQTSP